MKYDFGQKKVLVTGAGQGIGRAVALAMTKMNADVYALSRTKKHLDTLVDEAPSVKTIVCDLACDIETIKKAIEPHLPFDMLVNNAGTNSPSPFLEIDEANYDRLMHLNLKVPLFLSQFVAGSMVDKNINGAIVNVSSQASLMTMQGYTVYTTSKAGLDTVTKMSAFELGKYGIRVNSVNPQVTLTPLGERLWIANPKKAEAMKSRIPLGRFATVEEVVNCILFLLSDDASMVNGDVMAISGGLHNNPFTF